MSLFVADAEEAIARLGSNASFKDMSLDKDASVLSFALRGQSYSLVGDAAYPKNSHLLSESSSETVQGKVEAILKALESKSAAAPRKKKQVELSTSSLSVGDDDGDEDDDNNDDDDDDGNGGSDGDGDGDGDLDSGDMAEFASTPLCTPFKRDVAAVEHIFGKEAIQVQHAVGDDVFVVLEIRIDSLSDRVMEAWGLHPLPIHCQLKDMSASDFMRGGVPKIKVWQDDYDEATQYRGGCLPQLERIATEWVKEEWKAFAGRAHEYYQDAPAHGRIAPAQSQIGPEQQKWTKQLIEMGFSRSVAEEAVQDAPSLEDAVSAATTGPSKKKVKGGAAAAANNTTTTSKSTKQTTKATVATKSPVSKGSSNVDDYASKFAAEAEEKKRSFQVIPEHGFLAGCMEYLEFRLKNLHLYCPLCDCGHLFGSPMLKPACCTRELCAFAFNQLGLMKDTVDGVATHAAVVDLLVTLAKAAATSTRNTQVLNPFPQVPDPDAPHVFALNPEKPDYTLAKDAVCSISMSSLTFQENAKAHVPHRLSTALLNWIVSSNRSYLVKLAPEKEIPMMSSHHQFLMLSASPEQEEEFAKLKNQHGSVFCFHGSRSENWHSILRQGLRNASGTKLQLNGAAYGAGIYLSPAASLSLGYSQMYNHTVNNNNNNAAAGAGEFLDGSNFSCLAICEVINLGIKKHNATIWTVLEEKHVVTRFFIVYPPGTQASKAHGANTESAEFLKQIHNALAVDSISSLSRSARDLKNKKK